MDVKTIEERIATVRRQIALLNIELLDLERIKNTIAQEGSSTVDTRKLLND